MLTIKPSNIEYVMSSKIFNMKTVIAEAISKVKKIRHEVK